MTTGKILPLILRFAFPVFIGNLLQQVYNLTDAVIVGRYLGTTAIAGLGASSSVQFMVLGFCIGLSSGFGVPTAKYFGAGKYREMRSCVFHSLVLAAGLAVLVTTLCTVLCASILHVLKVPAEIYPDAYSYLLILFFGLPFTILYNLDASLLRAVGDSRTPFYLLVFSTILNVLLDLLCILVLQLGCAGAAAATVIAQAVSGIGGLVIIWKKFAILRPKKEECHLVKARVKEMLGVGVPVGLQFSITGIGNMVMQSANNALGSCYVSGFTVGIRIKSLTMGPFDALATGVSVFGSQNFGAGKMDRVREGLKKGVTIGVSYGILSGLLLIFGGTAMSRLFIRADAYQAEAVLAASAKYLRCMGYFYWLLGILNIVRMATQSLGFSGRAMFAGVMEMFARIAVCTLLIGSLGYTAICFADQAAWVAAVAYIVPICAYSLKAADKRLHSGRDA